MAGAHDHARAVPGGRVRPAGVREDPGGALEGTATRQALRSALNQVQGGLRLGALLRHPITSSAGVEEELQDRLARREQNFLWSVEHLIFAHPNSPYRPLLELAGYDLPRIRQLVAARGLDAALDQLCADGVYVRIQEFKGGEPTVRRGRTFRFQERDFANPQIRSVLQTRSSGSRSRGTQTAVSGEDLADHARFMIWLYERYGVRDRDFVLLATPGGGLWLTILFALMGRPPLGWFSPVAPSGRSSSLLSAVARLASGVPVPQMKVVPPDRVLDIARFISRANTPRGILMMGFVNTVLRLVLAAEEARIALGDVAFIIGGEPITAVKRRQIEDRGYNVFPQFGFSELGLSAFACPAARERDDLHVLTDRVALRQYQRGVDQDGASVPAYLFTSLVPYVPHVLLNMESGDYGGLEERRCGCFLDDAGFRLHMHTIRSFEKLTAEGITFIGPSLINLLEEILPRQFGGDSRHYQLVEAEDEQGFTRLYVLVSPRLGPLDEQAVRRTVLQEIGSRHLKGAYGRVVERVWEQADTVQVLRRDPLPTGAGKILHLHRDRGTLRAEGDEHHGGGSAS